MSNFKRSSIYVHFDNLDQKIVTPWLSLLKKRFWDVMDSSQDIHVLPAHKLAKYDLIVLVISKNVYTSDGEIKPEIYEFFNLATKTIRKNIILITLGKTKIPDRFSDDNFPIYEHKNKDSTINFLEYLRRQDAITNPENELEKINRNRLEDLSQQVNILSSQIQGLKDEIADKSEENTWKLSKQIAELKNLVEGVLNDINSVKASVSSSTLNLDTNESFQSLSSAVAEMSQQVKDIESKIRGFIQGSNKRAFSAAPNSPLYFMVVITAIYLVTALFMFSALSQMSLRIQSVLPAINVDTPIPSLTSTRVIKTPTPAISPTLNPTQQGEIFFRRFYKEKLDTIMANIVFNKPEQMKLHETAIVELFLHPSQSIPVLATEFIEQGGFVTSTADPNVLIGPNGETVMIETGQIEITPRMKAVLVPQNSESFTVVEIHDNAEQVISPTKETKWRWSVTAKKEGSQTLELVIFQLVKSDGKEFWQEVETYEADILVEVTPKEWFKSWWAATIGTITAIAAIIISIQSIWKWFEERKKKAAESEPPAPVRTIK